MSWFSNSDGTACTCTSIFTNVVTCLKSHPYVATAVVAVVSFLFLRKRLFKPKLDQPLVKNPQHNKVYLYQFKPVLGLNASPFCMKVETFLKVLGADYETLEDFKHLERFSRHKLPVIQFNTEIIQDSQSIVAFLDRKFGATHSQPTGIDHGMSTEDLATASLLRYAVEDTLSPLLVYFRWIHEAGWQVWHKSAFSQLPNFLKPFILPIVRKNVRKGLLASGVGRYPESEMLQKATEILQAVHVQLGKKKFLFGDKFRTIDASVYGVLANIILCPIDTPLQRIACQHDNLVTYVKTVRDFAEASHQEASASRTKQ